MKYKTTMVRCGLGKLPRQPGTMSSANTVRMGSTRPEALSAPAVLRPKRSGLRHRLECCFAGFFRAAQRWEGIVPFTQIKSPKDAQP